MHPKDIQAKAALYEFAPSFSIHVNVDKFLGSPIKGKSDSKDKKQSPVKPQNSGTLEGALTLNELEEEKDEDEIQNPFENM